MSKFAQMEDLSLWHPLLHQFIKRQDPADSQPWFTDLSSRLGHTGCRTVPDEKDLHKTLKFLLPFEILLDQVECSTISRTSSHLPSHLVRQATWTAYQDEGT